MSWAWIVGIIVVFLGLSVMRGAPYVPSQKRYIKQALTKLYTLTAKDVLVDLGSGDGIVLRLASKYKAQAIGYEINPVLALISKILSFNDHRVQVRMADFWSTDLPSNTTVVYIFITSGYLKKLSRKMQSEADRLDRPLKIIMYGATFDDRIPEKNLGAYSLHTFFPLQIKKA